METDAHLLSGLAEWLTGWFALPRAALTGPAAGPLLFAFGVLHAFLPGHGKALLAARQPMGPEAPSMTLPLLDGVALAGARSLVAFALVVGGIGLAQAFGLVVPVRLLRLAAGCALAGIGLHLVVHAVGRRRVAAAAVPGGTIAVPVPSEPAGLGTPLVLLALTPEPVALALASFGVATGNVAGAAWAILCLALGMGATLGATAWFAARKVKALDGPSWLAGLPIGLVLVATGGLVVASAW